MHLAVAIRAKRDGVRDGILATDGKPNDMMTFEVSLVPVIFKGRWLFAKVA
jgi:hypothetical protein